MTSYRYRSSARRSRGFTLMELMAVVAIIAILVGIAVPTYQDSVRKSRRGQAKSDLAEAAQAMERYYTINSTYVGANLNTIYNNPPQSPKVGTAHYTISFDGAVTANSFILQAVPSTTTGQDKDKCGTMNLSNTGAKGPSSIPAECWNK
ncbi:type IV pilin protein [Lysobacter sp. BMK333-48F3]|uniref:type IV pilin protein n=1 Tax=Lysobacter sp. BMK333-48F3 TaxID=2867962 RepID=UPI001C8C16AA|nr:type IV pilin protein [Lysobacter sp. BMK333-48F3]MBX9403987.1 type IV pilin protein [Lysobacter sp. BMK333-48F3]